MTISLAASNAGSGFSTNPIDLTLSSIEGNLQVVMFGHRTSSLVPSITGAGWSTAFLIETLIIDGNSRRALVMYWRVVPAGQSATITVDWSGSSAKAAVSYEWSSDTAGGTWSFDSTTGRNSNDNGILTTTSLASNAVTPEFAEAVAVDAIVTRHGAPASEDSYSDLFITGVGAQEGPGSTNVAVFSGYKIVDTAPAAMSTTASWTTSALATSIIGVWSTDAGGGPVTINLVSHAVRMTHQPLSVTADGIATATLASHAIAASHQPLTVTADTGTVTLDPHAVEVQHQPLAATGAGSVTVTLGSHQVDTTHRPLTVSSPAATVTLDPHAVDVTHQALTATAVGQATLTLASHTVTLDHQVLSVEAAGTATTTLTPHQVTLTHQGLAVFDPALTADPHPIRLTYTESAAATFTEQASIVHLEVQ